MAEPTENENTPADDAAIQEKFNALFEGAVAAYLEKNKPAPDKTHKPELNIFNSLFGG